MSQDQSKSLLQQISKDHYEQTEPKTADIQEEEKPDTVSRQTTFSDGYQTDSSLSPSIPFISAVQSPCSSLPPLKQSPTPSVSDWQDASSEILSDKDNIDDVDGDLASKYPLVNFGLSKRKLSRGQSGSQRSKKMPNIEDIEFPSLDYGPHLQFFPDEYGMYYDLYWSGFDLSI